jgi:hypothetical protein
METPSHPNFVPLDDAGDHSTSAIDTRSSTNNTSNHLTPDELALWESLENIVSMDEFEKGLPNEGDEIGNDADRRSTRIFHGVTFH